MSLFVRSSSAAIAYPPTETTVTTAHLSMNRSIPLLTSALLVSFGMSALLPVAAHGTESHLLLTAQADMSGAIANVGAQLNIEDRIQGDLADIEQSYTFEGKQNEMIVIYVEAIQGSEYFTSLSVIDSEGEQVQGRPVYHGGLDFAESGGRHRVFLLPKSGTYRINFKGDAYESPSPDISTPPVPVDFLLKARLAPYIERLIIHASNLLDEERYSEAIPILDLATEEDPTQPLPYLVRALARVAPALDEIDESQLSDDVDHFVLIYGAFEGIVPETQLMVIEDIKDADIALNALYAAETITPEEADVPAGFLTEAAAFLATGVVSDELREIVGNNF